MAEPRQPARIASLLASGTEILYGLGLGNRVVAVSHECDFPDEVRHQPRVTSTRVAASAASKAIDDQVRDMLAGGAALYEIDVDKLAELRPDLIVTQAQCDVCAVRYEDVLEAIRARDELRQADVVALNPRNFGEIFDDIRRVGQAAGVPDEARRYVARLRERVERICEQTSRLRMEERPRVLCIEWVEPVMASANWIPELVELAGGRHDLTRGGVHSTDTAWKDVLAYDPQVVVVMPCGLDLARTLEEAQTLRSLPDWDTLAACRAGRVFACDGNAYFNRSGPRIVESLELLAELIHPERFASLGSPDERVRICQRLD